MTKRTTVPPSGQTGYAPGSGASESIALKIFLNILLVVLGIFSCYAEDIYLHFQPPGPEKPVYLTIRCQLPFNFDQEKAFGSKRNLALSQYIPLYSFTPDNAASSKKKMQDLINKASSFQSQERSDGGAYAKYLRKDYGIELSSDAALQLLQYPNLRNLLEAIRTIEESILQSKIIADPQPLKGKKTAEVRYPDPIGTIAYPATEFITLEEARRSLQNNVYQVFWQVDRSILDPVLQISLATILPNVKYDKKENDRRIEEIIRRFPSRLIPYRTGEVLVPFRKILSEEDVLLLAAHQEAEKQGSLRKAPWVIASIVFMVVLYNLLLSKILGPWSRKKPPYLLLLSMLITTVFIMKTCLLFTSFPIYALPIGMLPLLLLMLIPHRIFAPSTTILGVMLVSFFTGRTLEIFLFYAFGGLLIVLTAPVIRKRFDVAIPLFVLGLTNVVVLMLSSLDLNALISRVNELNGAGVSFTGEVFNAGLLDQTGWSFAGGLAAGPVALLVLPLLEVLWNTASSFKLHRFIDLQHPLLKNLLTKAPGTYQHTMTVAYLAEASGEAIGVNTLLLRVGAYYHDIGKTAQPKYFIENQFNGKNAHDEIDPQESTKIVLDHVRNGKRLALEAGLPGTIADFIPQHHGTLLVEFFFYKASQAEPTVELREEDFRYPGPRPQSVEAAILMICDAVEAASRTLSEPTRDNIRKLISFVTEKRLADGQFEECDLTTHDLGKIIQVLSDSIAASFHTRVEYPWQQGEKKEPEGEHSG
jgi:cyclic-di-AMP phosphodiesterase PgpH